MCFPSFKAFVTRSNESTQIIHQHTKHKNNTYKKIQKKCKKTQTTMQKEKQKLMI